MTVTGSAVTSLSGQTLRLHTADAAGRPLWSRNAQGTVSIFTHEPAGDEHRARNLAGTLTEMATGRERLPDTVRGPQVDGTGAGGTWFPYTEAYTYDDGDNLTGTVHTGNRPWSREMVVSSASTCILFFY